MYQENFIRSCYNNYGMKLTKAQKENDDLYYLYFNRLLNLSMNRFKWKNLPFSIDARFLELTLNFMGMGVGFRNETNGQLMFTQVVRTSELNVYYNPVYFQAYGVGGFEQNLSIDTGVICYNDYTRLPTIQFIEEYAKRLADIQRTIDVHVYQHKIPRVWLAPKNKTFTLKNLFSKLVNNEPIIYADESLVSGTTNLGVINSDIQYIIDKLMLQKKEYWNEAMTYLGINNANMDKKERLVENEVEANNGQIEQARNISLNTRKEFCKKFNLMFDMKIDVEFNEEQSTLHKEDGKEVEEENEVQENE